MFKKLNIKKSITILFFILVSVLWGSVLIIGNKVSAIAWAGLMFFSILGVLTFIIMMIIMIINYYKHKVISKREILLSSISVILAYPILWLFGVGRIPYPASNTAQELATTVRLPVNEEVVVGAGGNNIKTNENHLMIPSERWAYDLVGRKHSLKSDKLEDYSIYGMDLVAPEDGVVVDIYDEEKDLKPGDENFKTTLGNYIYIKLDKSSTYLVIAHIKQGSILVKKGDHIKKGMIIAKVGNSGSSSEPHIHIQHQKENPAETNALFATAIPLIFENIKVDGEEKTIEKDYIESGKVIEPVK